MLINELTIQKLYVMINSFMLLSEEWVSNCVYKVWAGYYCKYVVNISLG